VTALLQIYVYNSTNEQYCSSVQRINSFMKTILATETETNSKFVVRKRDN